MVTANSLSLYSKMTLTVTRDIATAWERYIYHGKPDFIFIANVAEMPIY